MELDLNPFEIDYVSSSYCVSMTVVFVVSGGEQQENGLFRTTNKQ